MSENTEFSSLAQKLAKEGMHKTPIARAVAEVVASWLGTNITDRGLITALQDTRKDAIDILQQNVATPPANDENINEKKAA